MAHKKAGGSTALGRDSHGQRLGVKRAHGERVLPGQIIVRQRGTKIHPGVNVLRGKDDTLFAHQEGLVQFYQKKAPRFNGRLEKRTFVKVALSSST